MKRFRAHCGATIGISALVVLVVSLFLAPAYTDGHLRTPQGWEERAEELGIPGITATTAMGERRYDPVPLGPFSYRGSHARIDSDATMDATTNWLEQEGWQDCRDLVTIWRPPPAWYTREEGMVKVTMVVESDKEKGTQLSYLPGRCNAVHHRFFGDTPL